MRSMKTLLRLLGAVSLTTVAASSVVACGSKAPDLHVDIAKLLGWYDSDGKSLINQKLVKNDNETKYSIIAEQDKITSKGLFKTKLLIQINDKENSYKAISAESAKFLSDLGFKSGNESTQYSSDDLNKIANLSAKVTNNMPGNIEENGADFKISDGSCSVDIINSEGDKSVVVKSYTIKTLKNDNLGVSIELAKIVIKDNLDLSVEKGYQKGKKVITSLYWKSNKNKESSQYDSLVTLFSNNVKLLWSSDPAGTVPIYTYTENQIAYLTLKFGEVKVISNLNCGNPN